jgi:hypothetical protein
MDVYWYLKFISFINTMIQLYNVQAKWSSFISNHNNKIYFLNCSKAYFLSTAVYVSLMTNWEGGDRERKREGDIVDLLLLPPLQKMVKEGNSREKWEIERLREGGIERERERERERGRDRGRERERKRERKREREREGETEGEREKNREGKRMRWMGVKWDGNVS